jgi:hypothetical protein
VSRQGVKKELKAETVPAKTSEESGPTVKTVVSVVEESSSEEEKSSDDD